MSARPITAPPGPAARGTSTRACRVLAWLTHRREALAVAALLLIAAALRLGLAAHGWPYLNSDEAVLGLMSMDIARGGAHPIFSYGQNYIGAFQAYLAAPLFMLFHGDPLALRLATLIETMLFMGAIYALTRRVYSPAVALLTLALLTFGSGYLLKHELQAGAGAQDTLLFGALTILVATLRLRGGWSPPARLGLDAALGLTIGFGLWCDFLFLPYVFAAALALGHTAARRLVNVRSGGHATMALWRLTPEAGALLGALILGAAPLIAANIASHGATFHNVSKIAGAPGSSTGVGSAGAHPLAIRLASQIATTLLAGLPNALGSEPFCRSCAIWPAAGTTFTTPIADAVRAALISAPFTLVAIGLWLATALPLARDTGRALLRTTPPLDARWWGRFMLTLGAALTVAQYAVSAAAYARPNFTSRYLIGIYIAAPLVVAPLAPAARAAWGALRASRTPNWRELAATGLLALLLGMCVFGAADTINVASNTAQYGDPLNTRDAPLVRFLETHHATAFYTGYWTCGRLILATNQRLNCAAVVTGNAFAPGFNRYPPAERAVHATAHPAWVFDMRALDVDQTVPQQVAACVAASDQRCVGYVSATVNGYLIYYYPNSPG